MNSVGSFDKVVTSRRDFMLTVGLGLVGIAARIPGPSHPTEEGRLAVNVLPRSAWEARNPITERLAPHSGPLRYMTVHHAGDQLHDTGPSRYREWQRWHMGKRGWGDLAYHYIVGIDGAIYAGRDLAYRGDTATTYDTDGHFLVVVEGNFERDDPTAAQLRGLSLLLASASDEHGISPAAIAAHRDYANTSCPGENLYPYVSSGALRRDVESLLRGQAVVLTEAPGPLPG